MGLGFGRPVADVGFDPARRPGSHRIRSDGLHLPAGERAEAEGARGPFRRPGRRLLGRGPRRGGAAARKRAVGRFSVSGRINSSRIHFFFYFRSILNMNLNEFA